MHTIGGRLRWRHVVEIRTRYAAGDVSQQSLADEYGVSQPLVGQVIRWVAWDRDPHRLCEVCGKRYKAIVGTQKQCRRCLHTDRHRQMRSVARNERLRNERLATKSARPCLHCGALIGAGRRVNAAYCSARCNSAAHQAARKAKRKLRLASGAVFEPVDRAYIIARDRSRCYLCGKKCKPSEIHLDHVLPLARGGSHTKENLRVACAKCNTSKRADARNEQLLLVG